MISIYVLSIMKKLLSGFPALPGNRLSAPIPAAERSDPAEEIQHGPEARGDQSLVACKLVFSIL